MAVITVNSDRFNSALARLAQVGGPEAIRPQAGLLVRELISITPPKSLSQGRKAVARDLRRAVEPLILEKFRSKRLQRAIAAKNAAQAESELSFIRKIQWSVVGFDAELHRSARNSRGRVPYRHPVATLDVVAWRKYLRYLQGRVGRMKAAWRPAAERLGVAVAAFVARQVAPSGSAVDNLRATDPSFRMDSFAPGVESETGRLIRRALEGRAKAIAGHVRYLLREAAQKGGL